MFVSEKGNVVPFLVLATEQWGSGEMPLCLCNVIKELTPDLLGVGFVLFCFLHLSPQLFGDSCWAAMSLRAK